MHRTYEEIYQRWLLPGLLSFSFFGTNLIYIQSRGSSENPTRVFTEEQDVVDPEQSGIITDEALREPSIKAKKMSTPAVPYRPRKLTKRRPAQSDISWGTFQPAAKK